MLFVPKEANNSSGLLNSIINLIFSIGVFAWSKYDGGNIEQ